MIHKFLTNTPNRYSLYGLLAVFDATELPASSTSLNKWYAVNDHDHYYYIHGPNYIYTWNWNCSTSNSQFSLYTDSNGCKGARRLSSNTNYWFLQNTSTNIYLASLMNSNQFSIQMTCTYEDFTSYKGMFGLHQSGNDDGVIGGQYESGYVKFGIFSGGTAYTVNIATANMPTAGTRFNWALTCNNKLISLYINNELKGTVSTPNNISLSSTLGVTLGCAYGSSNRFTSSTFYSVLLYNKALSTSEISHNYFVDKRRFKL